MGKVWRVTRGVCLLTGHHVGTKEDPDGGDKRAKHHHEANKEPETSSWQQRGQREEDEKEETGISLVNTKNCNQLLMTLFLFRFTVAIEHQKHSQRVPQQVSFALAVTTD